MLRAYIAAGFDPGRFWDLTVRLFDLEMQGAELRHQRERGMVWCAAMLPHLKKPPTFEAFVKPAPRRQAHQDREALQVMCDVLAAAWGAKEISA